MFKKKLLLVPLMLLAAVGSLQAASAPMIHLNNYGWDYSVSEGTIGWVDAATSTLQWGATRSDSDLSSLQFEAADIYSLPLTGQSSDVSLGTLYYHNGRMPFGDNSTLEATLKLGLDSEIMPLGLELMNRFRVVKGTKNPVDQGARDSISISSYGLPDKEYLFTLDKQKYSLALIGFFDGDVESSEAYCDEGGNIKWDLRATVTNVTPSSVPIPATAWLLGSGLLGLLGFRRRQTV